MYYLYKATDHKITTLPIGFICYDVRNNDEIGWEFLVEMEEFPREILEKINHK